MKGASFTSFRLIVSQINYNGMLLKLTTKQKIALQSKNKFFHLYKLDTDSENVLLGIICLLYETFSSTLYNQDCNQSRI